MSVRESARPLGPRFRGDDEQGGVTCANLRNEVLAYRRSMVEFFGTRGVRRLVSFYASLSF
jgi:hypothetical protein